MNESRQTDRAPAAAERAADVAATAFSVLIYAVMVWVVLHSVL